MSQAVTHTRQRTLMARFAAFRISPGKPDQMPRSTASPLGHRHHSALAVLTAARGVVQRGWAQNAWYVMENPAGRRRRLQSIFPSRLDRTHVVEACLVGAVMHAAWQQSPRPERAYPAIDALWHTLLGGDPAGTEPVGPLSSPPVRLARVRDLTTWNDRRYRTREEVVDLLDRTMARIAEADRRTGRPIASP